MSAQPSFSGEFLNDAILQRICAGEALCAAAEALAIAGELRRARSLMRSVETMLQDITRLTRPSVEQDTGELEECLRQLRHRARNAETVLKLIE